MPTVRKTRMYRLTADRLLADLLKRVQIVNHPDSCWGEWIEEVQVFGSYLGDQSTLGDLDIATRMVRRSSDWIKWARREFQLYGPSTSYKCIGADLDYARDRLRNFIRGRSGYVSLHDIGMLKHYIGNPVGRTVYVRSVQ